MSLYNINIQFPNHYYAGPVLVNDESLESGKISAKTKETGLITTFPKFDGIANEKEKEVLLICADFFQFGADYFEKGKLSGDDVAAKLRNHLGEIWLGNKAKSNFNYHFTGVWPHSVNFGELCYSSDTFIDLEITWRYQKCELCNAISQ